MRNFVKCFSCIDRGDHLISLRFGPSREPKLRGLRVAASIFLAGSWPWLTFPVTSEPCSNPDPSICPLHPSGEQLGLRFAEGGDGPAPPAASARPVQKEISGFPAQGNPSPRASSRPRLHTGSLAASA